LTLLLFAAFATAQDLRRNMSNVRWMFHWRFVGVSFLFGGGAEAKLRFARDGGEG